MIENPKQKSRIEMRLFCLARRLRRALDYEIFLRGFPYQAPATRRNTGWRAPVQSDS